MKSTKKGGAICAVKRHYLAKLSPPALAATLQSTNLRINFEIYNFSGLHFTTTHELQQK